MKLGSIRVFGIKDLCDLTYFKIAIYDRESRSTVGDECRQERIQAGPP